MNLLNNDIMILNNSIRFYLKEYLNTNLRDDIFDKYVPNNFLFYELFRPLTSQCVIELNVSLRMCLDDELIIHIKNDIK
jgi:hypothetical protein